MHSCMHVSAYCACMVCSCTRLQLAGISPLLKALVAGRDTTIKATRNLVVVMMQGKHISQTAAGAINLLTRVAEYPPDTS